MIEITANTRRAIVTNKELLTAGSAGIQVQFTLSEDWAGLAKVAVFRQGDDGEKVDCVLDSGMTCVVPSEVLTIDDEVVFCGIYGSNGQGTIIIPTIWASLGVVRPGTEPNTPATAAPTPEIWAQILNVAQDAEATADEAMSLVEAGLSDLSALEATVEAAEASRVLAEQGRVSAESQRVTAENNRVSAENARVAEENERNTAELARANAEQNRTTAENARVGAEASRVSAEQSRVAAEQYREEKYAEYVETVSEYAEAASGSATLAANYAREANTKATAAGTFASQANESALAANIRANRAAASATEAAQSASTATGAATTATTQAEIASTKAAEAASSATDAAGSAAAAITAQAAAETAQAAAETAQAAAEDAADSVSASAAQIDQNTSDISDLTSDVADLSRQLSEVTINKTPQNYFPFEGQPWNTSDVVATYNGDDISMTFTETSNPIVCFTIPGLISGQTYKISFAVTQGFVNETANLTLIRKYNATNPHDGAAFASLYYTNHVASGTFTVPNSDNAVTLELNLRYNSKLVTLSDMMVTLSGDAAKTVVRANAMNENDIKASFVYSTNTGDCTILKILGDESDKAVMIDCMDTTTVARTSIKSALDKNIIEHIDYFILSHYHSDHFGNIQWLIDNGYLDANTIFILPQDVDGESEGLNRDDNPDKAVIQNCANVLNIINNLGAVIVRPTENDVITINDCKFVFWNCDHTAYYERAFVDYNECSLCCTMIYGATVVQFTGDIGPVACAKYYDKLYKCNIFKANHHACGYAVVPRFMSAVYPQVVVSMTGRNVIYSTDPAIQAVFATLTNGLQAWCEREFVPNYVTGVIGSNIYITITKDAFKFDSASRRCVRSDESIPVT